MKKSKDKNNSKFNKPNFQISFDWKFCLEPISITTLAANILFILGLITSEEAFQMLAVLIWNAKMYRNRKI